MSVASNREMSSRLGIFSPSPINVLHPSWLASFSTGRCFQRKSAPPSWPAQLPRSNKKNASIMTRFPTHRPIRRRLIHSPPVRERARKKRKLKEEKKSCCDHHHYFFFGMSHQTKTELINCSK